jgi:hypothetical protein
MIRFINRQRDQDANIPTNGPKVAGYRFKQSSRICSGSTRIKSSSRYVPASLNEILTLKQCASWLQQPESLLREMIQAGIVKPLPFPGENYRLHARTVLLQLGVAGEALGQLAKPLDPTQDAVKGGTSCPERSPGFQHGFTEETTLGASDNFTTTYKQNPQNPKLKNNNRRYSPPALPPKAIAKSSVIRRSYRSHSRLIEVTHLRETSTRQQIAEANVLDVVVNSIKRAVA